MSEDVSRPVIGRVVAATHVVTHGIGPGRARNVVLLLAASVALMMIGFGIILPVFGRRLGEIGSGVEALGLMTMAFALGQLVAGPYMGTLADRIGRRPLVLVGLAGFAVANVGFLFAPNAAALIGLRGFEGVVTAGLFPAAMGVISDIFPEEKRGHWVGIIMGGYGAGFIFGPVAGGILYDVWGFAASFVASASLAFAAFIAAVLFVPETNTREDRRRAGFRRRRADGRAPTDAGHWWTSIPRPLHLFVTLLLIDFALVFGFAFIEPQLVFYAFEDLEWTTVQLGIVVGIYGIAMVLGQAFLGRSSDRFGRGPVILLGIVMATVLYVGLVFVTSFPILMLIAAFAGLGLALVTPALSALYIDVTEERYRSRVLGLKQSAAAFGGVAGPLLLVAVGGVGSPQAIFGGVAGVMLVAALLAIVVLRQPHTRHQVPDDLAWQLSRDRALAAESALSGIVMCAISERSRTT